jgi:hypothetical protein
MRSVNKKQLDHAHMRLLMAVISFVGADEHGSQTEVRAAAIELREATIESENVLFSTEVPHD